MEIDTHRSVATLLDNINPNLQVEAEGKAILRVKPSANAIAEILVSTVALMELMNSNHAEIKCRMRIPKDWVIEDNILYGDFFGTSFCYKIIFEDLTSKCK